MSRGTLGKNGTLSVFDQTSATVWRGARGPKTPPLTGRDPGHYKYAGNVQREVDQTLNDLYESPSCWNLRDISLYRNYVCSNHEAQRTRVINVNYRWVLCFIIFKIYEKMWYSCRRLVMLGHLFRKYFALLYSLIGEHLSTHQTYWHLYFLIFFSNGLYKHVIHIYLIKYAFKNLTLATNNLWLEEDVWPQEL